MERAYYSNSLKELLDRLKKSIYEEKCSDISKLNLKKKYIIVPNLEIQEYIYLKFSEDEDFLGLGFIDVILLKDLPNFLGNFFDLKKKIPSFLDLKFEIEKNIFYLLKNKGIYEQKLKDFDILLNYLNIVDIDKYSELTLKKISKLAYNLVDLFILYSSTSMRKKEDTWQKAVFFKTFEKFTYFFEDYKRENIKKEVFEEKRVEFHLFHLPYMEDIFRDFFTYINQKVIHYIFSPCKYFWEDIFSSKEKKKLSFIDKDFEKNISYFDYGNELLANFGNIQKKYLEIVDKSPTIIRNDFYDDNYPSWQEKEYENEIGVLQAIKNDIMHLMDNPKPRLQLDLTDFQIHETTSILREVEVLHDFLIEELSDDSLSFSDVAVYVEDIEKYAPYIHFVFSKNKNIINYKISNLDFVKNSFFSKAIFDFFSLKGSKFNFSKISNLLENPCFYKKIGFTEDQVEKLLSWLEKANILWGIDEAHAKKVLQKDKDEKIFISNDWENGLRRILLKIIFPDKNEDFSKKNLSFKDSEILNKFLEIFTSIKEDISFFEKIEFYSLRFWAQKLKEILEKYFTYDFDDQVDQSAYKNIISFIDKLYCSYDEKDKTFSFESIYIMLKKTLSKKNAFFNKSEINAVSFSKISESIIDTKITCFLGMDENFPVKEKEDLFNILLEDKEEKNTRRYFPKKTDFIRNAFLQALIFSKKLFFTYVGISFEDGSTLSPSNFLLEIISYIKNYRSFHSTFFNDGLSNNSLSNDSLSNDSLSSDNLSSGSLSNEGLLNNLIKIHPSISYKDIKINSEFENKLNVSYVNLKDLEKNSEILAINNFGDFPKELEQLHIIEINDLQRFAKNPLKFYCEEKLNLFLNKKEDICSQEKFKLSNLDKFLIKRDFLYDNMSCDNMSCGSILEKYEREGLFPSGVMHKIAKKKILKDMMKMNLFLKEKDISKIDWLNISLDLEEKNVLFKNKNELVMPKLEIELEGQKLFLFGNFQSITYKGMTILDEYKFENMVKIWPSYLIFLILSKKLNVKPALHFLKNEKTITFNNEFDPGEYLKKYLHYFQVANSSCSILFQAWSKSLITKDYKGFEKAFDKFFENINVAEKSSFNSYIDQHESFFFQNKKNLLNPQKLFDTWSSYFNDIFYPLCEGVRK